jgi:hypothetical protein
VANPCPPVCASGPPHSACSYFGGPVGFPSTAVMIVAGMAEIAAFFAAVDSFTKSALIFLPMAGVNAPATKPIAALMMLIIVYLS